MKNIKTIKYISLLLLAIISFNVKAQTDKATTEKIIAAKHFTFVASSAMPMNSNEINSILSKMPGASGGGTINLTGSNYDVRFTPDSVVAYLPYYGRSFSPPINPNESGFKFTSKKFLYKSSARKKGGWDIEFNPQDAKENIRMNLTISKDGYATLIVNSNNKQSITYSGFMEEPKPAISK